MEFNKVDNVDKPWGREVRFAVEDKYLGKILEIRKGKRLSLQYHKRKKETMYILEGLVRLTLGSEAEVLGPGKSVTLNPGVHHRVEALEDTKIIEVSTRHMDDVVRIEDDHGRLDVSQKRPAHVILKSQLMRAYAKLLPSKR